MASSNNSNNPLGSYPGRSPFPGSESPSGTSSPVGSSPFAGSPFTARESGLLVPPSIQSPVPSFTPILGENGRQINTSPFSNSAGAAGGLINPSPFNGGAGGATIGTSTAPGAAGASGANTMEFQSIMRTLTTELNNFSRLLQNINRGGGAGGGGGGVGGVAGGQMTAQQAAAASRLRDPVTGKFTTPEALNRTLVQGGASGAPLNPGSSASPAGGPTIPPVTAPSTTAPLGPGGQPLPDDPNRNPNALRTARAGRHHIFSGSPVPTGPGRVHAGSMSPSQQAMLPAGTDYVQAPQVVVSGGSARQRGAVESANEIAQNVNAAYLQQQQAELEAGTGQINQGGRFQTLRNVAAGFFSQASGQTIRNRRRRAALGGQTAVDVPDAGDLAGVGGVGSRNQGVASGYVDAANQRNAAVNQAGANAGRGVAAGVAARKTVGAALNITGTKMSELTAGIPYIGGALSSIFAAAEGAGGYAELEFPMAQAALATGRRVVTSTKGRKRRFNDLSVYGISGELAQTLQTDFGVASGGRAINATAMGLIAQGLDASTAGRMSRGMGLMGAGFSRGPTDIGLGAMGLAGQLGITGVGLQAQFAEAFSNAGGNILGSGVGVTAGALAREAGVIARGQDERRGRRVPNRLRGVDALNMATQGIMGNIQASQNIGASVFGGSSLYDMMSFANAFTVSGSLRGARRMMEGETATETNKRLQGAFGEMATEFAMLGKFTEFQTTEFERRGGGGALSPKGVRRVAGKAAAATAASTRFSKRRIQTESGNLDTMYNNQDKILEVMEQNIQLQRQLLSSVSIDQIKDIAGAVMSINGVVVKSSATIASLLSQILNGVGSIISWFGGGGGPPPKPAPQQRSNRQKNLQPQGRRGQQRPPVSPIGSR